MTALCLAMAAVSTRFVLVTSAPWLIDNGRGRRSCIRECVEASRLVRLIGQPEKFEVSASHRAENDNGNRCRRSLVASQQLRLAAVGGREG